MPKKGYKQTEEHRRKAAKSKMGLTPWNKGLKGFPATKGFTGKKHTEETKKKMSTSNKIAQLGNTNSFKYGCVDYWHNKAWKLFGKPVCSNCNMTNEEHIKKHDCRLNMHCISEPKDYTLLIESNWEIYCKECHGKIDNGKGSEI